MQILSHKKTRVNYAEVTRNTLKIYATKKEECIKAEIKSSEENTKDE